MSDKRGFSLDDLETLLQREEGLLDDINTDTTSVVAPEKEQDRVDQNNAIQSRLQNLASAGEGVSRYKDTASGLEQTADFFGELAWGFGESASFGTLGVAAATTEAGKTARSGLSFGRHREWDEQTFAGNAGYIIGSGVGILIPITGWAKGLSYAIRGAKALSGAGKAKRASDIATQLGAKYAEKKGASQLAQTVANLGDDVVEGIVRESDEVLGFSNFKPFIGKRFKKIIAGNAKALDDAVGAMDNSIAKFAPEIASNQRKQLANDLMQVMIKNDPGDIHKILSKMPGIRKLGPRKQQMAVAAASNFATGLMLHVGNESLGNLTYQMAKSTGLEMDEQGAKMHPSLWQNKSGIGQFLGESIGHGLGFAAIAPAHYMRGGRAVAPFSMTRSSEFSTGLMNMMRSLKPIRNLSDEQAINRLRFMEIATQNHGGMSLRNFIKHDAINAPNWIETISGTQAKSALHQLRKTFAKEWIPYISKEIGNDLYGSLPRMITGSMLMQMPSLIQSRGDIGDPKEFATHALTGMFFAKKGRVFEKGRQLGWGGETIWQTNQKPEAYTAMPARAKAMNAAMNYMGIDIDLPGLRESLPRSVLRSSMEETGEWRYVKEIVKDYYTENVVKIEGTKDIETAYREKVESMGEKMTPHKEQKLQNALKILKAFDGLGPKKGEAFRDVTAEEAFDIIESINQVPDVGAYRNNINGWLEKVEGKTLSIAAQRYIEPITGFLAHTLNTLNIRYELDPNTNRMTMPKINIDKVINNLPPGPKRTALAQVAEAFNYQVAEGIKDGIVRLDTSKDITSLSRTQEKSLLEGLDAAVLNLNQKTYGADITADIGLFDANIMTNKDMRYIYREVKGAEQRNNFLSAFAPPGQESTTYNTLGERIKNNVDRDIESLKLDRPVKYILTEGQNPESQKNVIETYEKVRELYGRINGKYQDVAPEPISISEISSKLDNLFGPAQTRTIAKTETTPERTEIVREGGVFGDIITNNNAYSELLKSVNGEFMRRLGIEDATNKTSIMSGLTYLINGSIMEKSGSEGTAIVDPGGKFVRTSPKGLIMPESVSLFKALKPLLSKDQTEILRDVAGWYDNLEVAIKASGGSVKFSANMENIQKVIRSYGVDGMINLLKNAKNFSDIGKIEALADAPIKIEGIKESLNNVDMLLNSFEKAGTVDNKIIDTIRPQLSSLLNSLGPLQNQFDVARIEKNMPLLLAIEGPQNNFTKWMRNVEKFLEIDPAVEGNITTAYSQKVAELSLEALRLSRMVNGEINIDNYRNVIQKEINSESKNLPDKEHVMEINISPQKFQTKYGVFPHAIEKIMVEAYENFHNPGTDGVVGVMRAYDNLVELANMSATGAGIKNINQADLVTDAIQLIGNRVFRKRIKTLQLRDGMAELGEGFILKDPRRGLDGLNNILDLNNDYYQLSKEVIITDALGIARKGPLKAELESMIESTMEKGIEIDNPRNESLVLQQTEGVQVEAPMPRKLIRVVFGEVSAAFPLVETKVKIQDAFKEGGSVYNEMKNILGTSPEAVARLAELSKKYTGELSVDQVKDALNWTWTVQNMPHIVRETAASMDFAKSLDAIKRRKMAHIDKGKVLNQEYYQFLSHAYERGAIHSPIFAEMNNLLREIAPDGDISTKRQRWATIQDEAGNLTLRNIAERIYRKNREDDLINEKEYQDAIAEIDADISAVNAPTFLTKRAFMVELAKMGARPEWFVDGDPTQFKIGAIKPKGVHVSTDANGRMMVFYNKTAFFYDPKIAGYLNVNGMDGVTFKSGNKINKYRENHNSDVIETYTEPSRYQGETIGDIIGERITTAAKQGNYMDLPYDTHVTSNMSREHKGTVGANTSIHFPHSVGINEWMNTPGRIRHFKDLLIAAKNSEYASASILEQLMIKGRETGDAQYDRLPYEVMLQESGLILQPHLKEVAFDKLFKFFFQGGKISTNEVPNSSYNAMMPDVMTPIDNMNLPVRQGGSQRILGQYIAADFDLSTPFKKFGQVTADNKLQHTGSTFVARIEYMQPTSKEARQGDVIFIPEGKKMSFMIDGWFIQGDKAIDLAFRGRGDQSRAEEMNADLIIPKDKRAQLENMYNAILDKINPDHTYKDVMEMLRKEHNGVDIVNAQNRQPRNTMNDFVLTRLRASRKKGEGNASMVNILDLARTQDADHDFDKSSSFMSAPKDIYKHAAANGGLKASLDSKSWADELVHKITVDMTNDNNLNSSLREWMLNHENVEMARGQFVKLHNVATYILNALPNNGKVAEYIGPDRKKYVIKAKTDSGYYKTVDEISHWVKLYIDSYKKTMSTETLNRIIDDLLLGSPEAINDAGVTRRFNGLFEIVSADGTSAGRPIESQAIRDVIKFNILSPIKKYLRYNRGETIDPEQLGGLTLENVANGYSEFMYDIGVFGKNKEKFLSSTDKTSGLTESIDVSFGMNSLRHYVTKVSQNPFDRAMKQLYEVRNESESARHSDGMSRTSEILLKGEKELLSVNEKGVEADPYDVLSASSNRLWNYIKRDYDYAKLMHAQRRLQGLKDTREYYLAEPREVNAKKKSDLDKKIVFYEELIADAEIRIGAEKEFMEGRPTWSPQSTLAIGKQRAVTAPIVVWNNKGQIKEVIHVGRENQQPIYKTDKLIQAGRRFESVDPQQQKYLRSRHMAFNDLAFIDQGKSGRITVNEGQKAIIDKAITVFRDKLQIHRDDLKAKRITPAQYVVRAQGELHRILNGQYRAGIDSELMRKGFIWKMLAPQINRDVMVAQKAPDGSLIFDHKFYENAMESKVVEGYLTGVASGDKFSLQNTMPSIEASKLMKEIATRMALSHLALSKPEIDVVMDMGIQGAEWYKQQNMKDTQPNIEIYKKRETGESMPGYDEALGIIHDFIGKGKLINPFDMKRLGDIITTNTDVPLGEIFNNQSFSNKRHFGNYGEAPTKVETTDNYMKRIYERYRRCGK